MQDIFVSKDQRDLNQLIKSLEVFALRVDSVPVELLVHLGAMMEISIFSREAKVLQIASNAGEVTIAKANKFWFPVLVVCTARPEL
jgi:hypothetical protein